VQRHITKKALKPFGLKNLRAARTSVNALYKLLCLLIAFNAAAPFLSLREQLEKETAEERRR
jgi:hypothetical protein